MGEESMSLADEEQMLLDFDPSKLAGRLPRDIKRVAREEWHYMLWLQGKEYAEIGSITGFKRKCIWQDIKRVDTRMALVPTDMASVRKMALMSLRITRSKVLHSIELAHESKGGRGQVPWGHIFKGYEVAAGIDRTILERYTQTGSAAQGAVSATDLERSKIILDYMASKFGPESLDGFDEYYTQKLAMNKAKPIKAQQA